MQCQVIGRMIIAERSCSTNHNQNENNIHNEELSQQCWKESMAGNNVYRGSSIETFIAYTWTRQQRQYV